MPTFTDLQRANARRYMGMSKLFYRANSIFENALSTIENTPDDGSTFNIFVNTLNSIGAIEGQLATNSQLMLATEVSQEVKFDAIRNDAGLRKVGRSLIHQLAIMISMEAQEDYFGPVSVSSYPGIKLHDV